MKNREDKNTIKHFVAYLRKNGHSNLKIDRWPDDENSTTPEIDAIAGPYAIEHTSIDTYSNQRKFDDRFLKATDIESEFQGQFTCNLRIRFKHEDFTQPQNWLTIRNALKRFVRDDVPQLESGVHERHKVLGIPFSFRVEKCSEPPFCLRFLRSIPEEIIPKSTPSYVNTRPPLPDYFKAQLLKKVKKLAPYRHCGKTTVLLIESGDYAFMRAQLMLSWIRVAFHNNLPEEVAQIWYAAKYSDSDFSFKDFTSNFRRSP